MRAAICAYIGKSSSSAIIRESSPIPARRIYLDHAATTPVLPAARAAMADAMGQWANPSSQHRDGRAARAALEDARTRIKAALGWTGALIFTSGATEGAALAFAPWRHKGPKPLVSTVEHDAVLRQAGEGDRLNAPVDALGRIDLAAFAELLHLVPGGLVAVQHVNSETGVIQPIAEIVEAVDASGGTLFVDCAQSAGKLKLPPAALIAVSAHKFGGPPGIGALLVRDLKSLQATGGQEGGYRAGTENLPAIMGFAAALEGPRDADGFPPWFHDQRANRLALETTIAAAGGTAVCARALRSPMVASYHMPGVTAAAQLIRLDAQGFSVSAGSACSSGASRPSHVMAALGLDPAWSANVVRVSFGPATTPEEVRMFADAWFRLAAEARSRAA